MKYLNGKDSKIFRQNAEVNTQFLIEVKTKKSFVKKVSQMFCQIVVFETFRLELNADAQG